MSYNIICISDIHWGIANPDEQEKSLEFIFTFLDAYGKEIDLIVLAGDYWDSKLSLNSQEAIHSIQWFHRLLWVCEMYSITLRVFQGTMDHDNDQLEVLEPLENNFFKIFKTMTVEETLPGLTCCYCPDEQIQMDEYEKKYLNEILQMKDIGFFHGSFDLVLGESLMKKPDIIGRNNVIYRYNLWSPQIKGPLISGHWHNGKQYKELYYIGSPFRWEFGEDEEKGFLFIHYDAQDSSYYIQKILNPLSAKYFTYEVYSNLFQSKDDYTNIIQDIQDIVKELDKSYTKDKLRILVYIVDDKPENEVFLSALRQEIIHHRNCKITIKNKLKTKKKKETKKRLEEDSKRIGFIFDENKKSSSIIQEFIHVNSDNEVDVPLEYIEKQIKKYL